MKGFLKTLLIPVLFIVGSTAGHCWGGDDAAGNEPALRIAASASKSSSHLKLVEAEAYFNAGRKLVLEGRRDAARREFDQAIDLLLSVSGTATDRPLLERRLEELVDRIYRYDVDALNDPNATNAITAAFDKSPLDEIRELTFPIDPKLKSIVSRQLEATSSQLPLEMNDSVLSFVNYFTTGRGRATLVNGLKRSGRYRSMIQRILAEEGVPQELIFLAQAESGFLPRAVSYKAAVGMWQFVKWRGGEYGLKSDGTLDLRLDPEKATRAAARHLRDLYMQFGDWPLALAAYNCGPGCVDRAVQRTGYANFWVLRDRHAIPRETTNYVPIIMAMTIITKNLAAYGIERPKLEDAVEYDTMTLDSPVNVALIADAADQPISAIRELNPALLRNVAPNGYDLRLPKGAVGQVLSALSTVPVANRLAWRMHRVQPGDDLGMIAKRYKTAERSILTANSSDADEIEPGRFLVIPAAFVKDAPVKRPVKNALKKLSRRTLRPGFPTAGRRAALR